MGLLHCGRTAIVTVRLPVRDMPRTPAGRRTGRRISNRRGPDDPKTIVHIDMEFHRLIAQAANNRALTLARDPLGLLLYASSDFVITRLAQSTERLIAAHQRIYDAIAANDPDSAARWMLKHLDDFKRGCIMAGAVFDAPVLDCVDPDALAGITESLRK